MADKDESRALILGNGDPPSPSLFAELMAGDPLLLCADGGANAALALGRRPDVVVGDLDSVTAAVRAALAPQQLVCVDDDDTGTDLQKVLRYARRTGVRAATLAGVTGGRSDHVLWNLSMLKLFGADMELRIVDDCGEIRLVRGRARLRAAAGQKISLSPLGGPVLGIETRGLKFALRGEALELGVRDGISNEVVGDPVEVVVGAGDLLILVQRQRGAAPVQWLEV